MRRLETRTLVLVEPVADGERRVGTAGAHVVVLCAGRLLCDFLVLERTELAIARRAVLGLQRQREAAVRTPEVQLVPAVAARVVQLPVGEVDLRKQRDFLGEITVTLTEGRRSRCRTGGGTG